MSKNNAALYDPNMLIQAGIDPKTGLPLKQAEKKEGLKGNIKKLLRIVDEQDALNRFTWYNLPSGLDGQLIERILYYRGQGMFFYVKELDRFFFLPYCLDGSIDIYGQYTSVRPLPFNGSTEATKDGKLNPIAKYITNLSREPLYDIQLEELTPDIFTTKCVLLHDYSKQISQTVIPRQTLNDPLLDVMSDCIPFLRTALLNSTGVSGMRVNSQDEAMNVKLASTAIDNAALSGEKYIPVIGNGDITDAQSAATMFEKTKRFCDSFLDMGVPGFDLAVYKDGECILRHMNGYSDLENKVKMNGSERYNIYSCSKPITVVAAMQLFAQGKFFAGCRFKIAVHTENLSFRIIFVNYHCKPLSIYSKVFLV